MILLLVGILKQSSVFPASNQNKSKPVIVLDAGHGGDDPGKVGINGELEKDLKSGWWTFWKPTTWDRYNYLVKLNW